MFALCSNEQVIRKYTITQLFVHPVRLERRLANPIYVIIGWFLHLIN